MISRICVIGTGLIGCSFALALRNAGFTGHIVGCARHQSTLDEALKLGIIDSGTTDPADAAASVDLVMLTVPMQAVRSVLLSIRDVIGTDTIVTDGGSVKSSLIQDATDVLESLENVVPGHPIAGREQSGVGAAQVDLFVGKMVLLTPLPETRPEALETVTKLWEMTGAQVEQLNPETHDRVLAATSHLPHVLAFGLVDMLATRQEHEEIFRYAAGGFRDFTRIASSDPVMWRDICLCNKHEIGIAMDQLIENLSRLRGMVEAGDADKLYALFSRARDARNQHTGNATSLPGEIHVPQANDTQD